MGPRTRRALAAAAALVTLIGAVVYTIANWTRSQPCLIPPAGADPGPITVEGTPSGAEGPLVLMLGGDAMLGRNVSAKLTRDPDFAPWASMKKQLADVDVFAFNLETTITDQLDPVGLKSFHFRMDPAHAPRALGAIPVRRDAAVFASVANNHIGDFGPAGLVDTVAQLDAAGIAHAGAGATAREARQPAVITTSDGVRVGFVSVADHCGCLRMCRWLATDSRPGMWHVNLSDGSWQPLLDAVRTVDAAVDVTVVSLHWGPNYDDDAPEPWMEALAAALVEAGADVVHGHSAHHVLRVDRIDGKHVFYGLAGLMDDYVRRESFRNDLGLAAKLRFDPNGTQHLELVPVEAGKRVRPLRRDSDDYAEVMRRASPPAP